MKVRMLYPILASPSHVMGSSGTAMFSVNPTFHTSDLVWNLGSTQQIRTQDSTMTARWNGQGYHRHVKVYLGTAYKTGLSYSSSNIIMVDEKSALSNQYLNYCYIQYLLSGSIVYNTNLHRMGYFHLLTMVSTKFSLFEHILHSCTQLHCFQCRPPSEWRHVQIWGI